MSLFPIIPGVYGGLGGGTPQPSWSNVKLLLDFEGSDGATSTTDESSSAKTVTFNGNAQIDTAQFALGASSLLVDGSGDATTLGGSADWTLSGEFCVECFVRFNASPGDVHIAGPLGVAAGGTQQGWQLWRYQSNVRFTYWNGSDFTHYGASWSPSTGVWYHLAATRDSSNNLRVFVDGVMVHKTTSVTTTFEATNRNWRNGGDITNNRWFVNGWIDGVRLTKGEGVYVTDDTFIPPTTYPRS